MSNRLFDTYKHSVMPHLKHVFPTESEILMEAMCAYPSSNYISPHWKYYFCCCAQCTRIYISSPE